MTQHAAGRSVVTVRIAGEDYTIRADATPEYTEQCAAYVDRTIGQIRDASALIQSHKAAILSALAITDQLFRVRRELDALRAQSADVASRLASEVEAHLGARDLASPS